MWKVDAQAWIIVLVTTASILIIPTSYTTAMVTTPSPNSGTNWIVQFCRPVIPFLCYKVSEGRMTHETAVNACAAVHDGHLVTLEDNQKRLELETLLVINDPSMLDAGYWLGIENVMVEGPEGLEDQWFWEGSDTPAVNITWVPGYPTEGNAYASVTSSGFQTAHPTYLQHAFCEFPLYYNGLSKCTSGRCYTKVDQLTIYNGIGTYGSVCGTLIECARLCLRSDTCFAFGFNTTEGTCIRLDISSNRFDHGYIYDGAGCHVRKCYLDENALGSFSKE